MSGAPVLVTGGSGFVASHCILALLERGDRVRTTIRSAAKADAVRKQLEIGGASPDAIGGVEFVVADLESDDGWDDAVAGVEYALHVASPFPADAPKHEDELIVPAREGALRLLRAARAAGVKRVVLTSSFAAIGYGHGDSDRPSTEEDWTDITGRDVSAYAKSKTLAECAAWDYVNREPGRPELATVNPVAILGPVLGPDRSTSIQLVQRLLDGDFPGCPQLSYGIVDVRDVADLHLRAMTDPAAAGERFLALGGGFASIRDVATILKSSLGEDAKRVPTRMLPNWTVRLVGLFDASVRQIVPELGRKKNASNEKARRVLGWAPRSNEEAILATANSLRNLGLLKDS